MNQHKTEQAAIFLLGAAVGTTVGLIIAALFTPQSGPETRQRIKERGIALRDKVVSERDEFSERIRAATDSWVAQMQTIADELVAQGQLTAGEARTQIDDLLAKVRG